MRNMKRIEPKSNKKRLHVDLPEALHRELKLMAIKYNTTMTRYVMRCIMERLKKERKYDVITNIKVKN